MLRSSTEDRFMPAVLATALLFSVGCSTGVEHTSTIEPIGTTADETTDIAAAAKPTLISHQDLADRIEAGNPPLVLDVRSEEEFAGGHIPGAINIPHDQLEERLAELKIEPTDEVVVHCQRGGRAETCQKILLDAGYTNVLDLEGDFGEWQNLELPEE